MISLNALNWNHKNVGILLDKSKISSLCGCKCRIVKSLILTQKQILGMNKCQLYFLIEFQEEKF